MHGYSDSQLLKYACENNMIDLSVIQQEMLMKQNAEYLAMHPYGIWLGNDNYYHTIIREEGKKKQLKKKKQEDLEKAIIEYYKSRERFKTIDDVFEECYKEKLEYKLLKIQSYDKYSKVYKRFMKNNPEATDIRAIPFTNITEDDLDKLIYSTISSLSPTLKAFNDFKTILTATFKFAKKRKYTSISISHYLSDLDIPTNTFNKIHHDKTELAFTKDEECKMINKLFELGDIRALGLIVLFDTGLRIGELCCIRKSDIEDDFIRIHATEINYTDESTGKNKVEVQETTKTDSGIRDVYLTENGIKAVKLLLDISQDDEWLFFDKGKRIHEHGFRKKLYDVCDSLGIKKRSPHKVRKTYATKLIKADVSEQLIKEMMGHSDIVTTRRNYYVENSTPDEFREALHKASSF